MVTKGQIIDRIATLKPIIRGNMADIAERAGIDYNRFKNAVNGYGDIDTLEEVLDAIQSFAAEQKYILNQVIPD